jgi:hypothetical protein
MVNDFSKEVDENGTGNRMILFNIAGLTTLDPYEEPIGVVGDDNGLVEGRGSLICLPALMLGHFRKRIRAVCLLLTTADW